MAPRASVASNIRLKRIYDPPSEDDGYRVLSTRYWPRGVSRDAADEYQSKIAPSRELIKQYQRGDLTWQQFGRRYQTRQVKSNFVDLAAWPSDESSHCSAIAQWMVTVTGRC